jgi:hypothetical protein
MRACARTGTYLQLFVVDTVLHGKFWFGSIEEYTLEFTLHVNVMTIAPNDVFAEKLAYVGNCEWMGCKCAGMLVCTLPVMRISGTPNRP